MTQTNTKLGIKTQVFEYVIKTKFICWNEPLGTKLSSRSNDFILNFSKANFNEKKILKSFYLQPISGNLDGLPTDYVETLLHPFSVC